MQLQTTHSLPRIGDLATSRCAFFFDFDGTIAPIADHPDAVRVAPHVIRLLGDLHDGANGALAMLSGRPIAALDRFLAPLRLPAAGTHGLERRLANGQMRAEPVDRDALGRATKAMEEMAHTHPRLIVEAKPASVTLHFRADPDLEKRCLELAERLVAADPGLSLLLGKKVVELKAGSADKGSAFEAFMGEEPFRDRLPVFAGDDVTDEDVFTAIERWNGVSIRIGPGATAARFRARDIAAFHAWLEQLQAFAQSQRIGRRSASREEDRSRREEIL